MAQRIKNIIASFLTPLNAAVVGVALPFYAVSAYSFFHKELARKMIMTTTYYLMAVLVVLWIWSLVKYLQAEKFSIKKFLGEHGAGLLAALLLTVVIAVSVKPALRVLSDETNMASVARSMFYKKTVENVTQGYYYYGNFQPVETAHPIIEKRPFLMPYLVQTLHALFGYRIYNIFLANLIFLYLTFFCIYLFLSRYMERLWVFSAMVCVAAQPLVSSCGTSGSFDLSGAFCLVAGFVALQNWLEKPKAAWRFEFLLLCLAALAQSRPESLIFTALLGILLLFLGYLKKELISSKFWLLASIPAFLLPVLWQRLLITDQYENPKGVEPFSLSNIALNSVEFFKTFGRFDVYLPLATLLNIVGAAGVLFAAGLLIMSADKRHAFMKNKPLRDFTLAVGVILAAHWVVYTAYYFGKVAHPSSARYFVLTCILLSMAAVAFVRYLSDGKHSALFFIISCALFILYNPVAIENRFSNTQTLPRQYEYIVDFMKNKAPRHSLLITGRPGQYIVHEYGAVDFNYANFNSKKILEGFHRHLYQEIYVAQDVLYETDQPEMSHRLSADFKLETVEALQNTAYVYTRISRVVNRPETDARTLTVADPAQTPRGLPDGLWVSGSDVNLKK